MSVENDHSVAKETVMSLAQTLAELREKFEKILPESATAVMEGHIESLRRSGAVEQILKPGVKASAFTLKNQHDEIKSSVDLIKLARLS